LQGKAQAYSQQNLNEVHDISQEDPVVALGKVGKASRNSAMKVELSTGGPRH